MLQLTTDYFLVKSEYCQIQEDLGSGDMDETGSDNIDKSAYINDRNKGKEDDNDVVQSATPQHPHYIQHKPGRYQAIAGI